MQNGKEYAVALFRLAREQNALDAYEETFATVRTVFAEYPQYVAILHSPAIPLQERLTMLDEAFLSLRPTAVLSCLKVMCEKGHIRQLDDCVETFHRLAEQAKCRRTVTVYSARPLTAAQQEALRTKLCRITDSDIELRFVLDESLIGGVKVQLGDVVWDGSIVGRLHSIKGVIER